MSKEKKLGVHFGKDSSGHVYMMDAHGRVDPNAYALWLEYIRFDLFGWSPSFKSYYFMQSLTHLISAYDCVLGLSGTLGSKAEMDFLNRIYSVESYVVPYFLDTCTQDNGTPVGKKEAVLLDDKVYICRNKDVSYSLNDFKWLKCVDCV